MEPNFTDNIDQHRFELKIEDEIVFADYRKNGTDLHVMHVEAPLALRGTGAASRLMQAVADTAKAQNLNIIPVCGYAAAWLRRHAK